LTTQNTTKSKGLYTQIQSEEREIIMLEFNAGRSKTSIGRLLNRAVSTISREINRNKDQRTGEYRQLLASKKAEKRRKEASSRGHIADPVIQAYVIDRLEEGWTPELIAGRYNHMKGSKAISHETIYQFIYNQRKDLQVFLPKAGRKRKKRGSATGKRATKIPGRISIKKRPESVENRVELGHWEGDTMLSVRGTKSALCVLIERNTRLVKLQKIERKGSSEMAEAVIEKLKSFPKEFLKTITFDNGSENVKHGEMDRALGTKSYFCSPYSSWQKGSVENIIGVIRRDLPKKTNLNLIDDDMIAEIEWKLNNRPKKVLGFLTPMEAFLRSVALQH
jgi:transposase, IS30 family